MHIIRFQGPAGGILHGVRVDDATARRIDGDIFGDWIVTEEIVRIEKLLAPVQPPIVLCIGLNYRDHAAESKLAVPDFPVLFVKGPGAAQNPGDPIVLPRVAAERTDYEAELAVVIGKASKNVSEEDALDHVLGYTCANDVSARDWQIEKGGSQWCRGKGFDTFCPLGPDLVTREAVPNVSGLAIRTELNGEVMQDSTTAQMVFGVAQLVSFLSQGTTLLPGTVILTGTPPGVGAAREPPVFLRSGDTVTVEIEGLGRLTNPVVLED